MNYTRKPPHSVSATFTVSWVEEPITIPSVNSLPFDLLVKAQAHEDVNPLLGALPDEISTLLDAASGIEVQEFLDTWATASEKAENDAKRTNSLFDRLIRGMQ